MRNILITVMISLCAGMIDVLPMLKNKLDKNSILSAFCFYFIAPFIIFGSGLFGMSWWLKGAVITLALAIPNIIMIAKQDKKSVPVVLLMSIVIGTLIGVSGHLLNISLR